MDRDEGTFETDDFIGRAVIFLKDINFSTDNRVPIPAWYPVGMGFGDLNLMQGEMLISFSIVISDYQYALEPEKVLLKPETEDFLIEINVLGLRDVESCSLMPVKKPFVKFNLKSLLPPSMGGAVTNIKTQPSDSGPNPNINTTIKFSLQLPTDELFCPTLSCEVFDFIFQGKSQPLLGAFTIPIGDLLHGREIELEKDFEELTKCIFALQSHMNHMGSNRVY